MIDPANGRDGIFDVWVKKGKIAAVGKSLRVPKGTETIPAAGKWVLPGLVDAHVHLREPGGEESETIESGTRAAAAGGVTTVLAMANTQPPIDNPQQVRFVLRRALEKAVVRVLPVGAVTKGLAGTELTDITSMAREGCAALSDDGHGLMDSRLMRRALEYTKNLGIPLIDHCEDSNLSLGGVMNEGRLSLKLGLRGIPTEAESVMVARNVYLAQLTGAHVHCAHISSGDSVDLIRRAKKKRIPVTAEACPHHFTLTEEAIERYDTSAKMNPPLRGRRDLAAIREGLADGTIDVIASDHAPHELHSKEREFSQAPFGVIGLETLWALTADELVRGKVLSPLEAVRKLTQNPARLFHLPGGKLSPGAPADIALYDPRAEWTAERFFSKSSNSPFIGRKFKGRIAATIVGGRMVYENGNFPAPEEAA